MVAVAAIIFDGDGRILLGKHTYRKQHPWGILAGNLEYGEDPENATIRELLEETGLEGKVQRLLRAVSAKEDHHISLIYLCEIVKGAFHQSPEISAIQYFSTDDLPDMLFTEKILIAQIVNQLDTGK
jgi:ADP-ribose pyrophosphatase YjhB (NUDIX family)